MFEINEQAFIFFIVLPVEPADDLIGYIDEEVAHPKESTRPLFSQSARVQSFVHSELNPNNISVFKWKKTRIVVVHKLLQFHVHIIRVCLIRVRHALINIVAQSKT